MKPSAMLYRNLLSMEIEENIRSNPIDGVVLLANCDKSVPGALMGAVSADIPTVAGHRRGPAAGACSRAAGSAQAPICGGVGRSAGAGELDDADWLELERCLSCGLGACNTMGTASIDGRRVEALGMCLPGTASIPTDDPDRAAAAAERTGRRIVEMTDDGGSGPATS